MLDAWLGGGASRVVKETGTTGTVGLGLACLSYYRWLEVGLGYTVQGDPLSYGYQVLGMLAGGTSTLTPWLRFDVLGEIGGLHAFGLGNDLFVDHITGGAAARPYLGGRLGVSMPAWGWGQFGLWLNAGETVGQTVLHPLVTTCFFDCSTKQETFTLGGGVWSVGLGARFQLGPW